MIRVTIEMVPGGFEDAKYPIHVIEISNQISTTLQNRNRGDYQAVLYKKLQDGKKPTIWKTVNVKNFPRTAKNAYWLLFYALREVCK